MNTNNPWLDQNGNILSDDIIKSISKDWSAETWEEFLISTVDAKSADAEVLTSKYGVLCGELNSSVWGSPSSLLDSVEEEVCGAIRKLDERSQRIVLLHFWENKSTREIAKMEKLSFGRIQQIKKSSLSQIKDLLENALHTSSYLIGGSEKSDLPFSRDEEIKEVYRMDLEGSYLK